MSDTGRFRPADLSAGRSMHARKTNAKTQFDSWSRWYDRSVLQTIFFGPTHAAILDALGPLPEGAAVLDVGCGTGILAEQLLESTTAQVRGVDLSPGMVQCAEERCGRFGERARFVVGDSEHLPFPNAAFDVVTCCHSFHHYPNQWAVVDEFARVLKPQGTLFLADADTGSFWGQRLYNGFVNWLEGGVVHCSDVRFRNLFQHAGFEMIAQKRGGWIMPWMVNVGVRRAVAEAPRRAA